MKTRRSILTGAGHTSSKKIHRGSGEKSDPEGQIYNLSLGRTTKFVIILQMTAVKTGCERCFAHPYLPAWRQHPFSAFACLLFAVFIHTFLITATVFIHTPSSCHLMTAESASYTVPKSMHLFFRWDHVTPIIQIFNIINFHRISLSGPS